MKNKKRERFLDEEVASKSAKKAYTTLFNKIDNYISIKNGQNLIGRRMI